MRYGEEQWGTCSGPEGGPWCDELDAHDILGYINSEQVYKRDSQKQNP